MSKHPADRMIDALLRQLVAVRERSGESQTAIADRMETSRPAVNRLETRRGNPSLDTFARYCHALGIRVSVAPRLCTTPQQLNVLQVGVIVRSAAGTVACRYDQELGVVFGDNRPFPWERLQLPVTVLFDPAADREHLDDREVAHA